MEESGWIKSEWGQSNNRRDYRALGSTLAGAGQMDVPTLAVVGALYLMISFTAVYLPV